MKRVGQWSVHYDTVEIRILVDSWKGVLLSAEDGEAATDGWQMMTSSPRVDQSWVRSPPPSSTPSGSGSRFLVSANPSDERFGRAWPGDWSLWSNGEGWWKVAGFHLIITMI